MKYKIEITEILQNTIDVEASTLEEAIEIVKLKYRNEEIILDDSNFIKVEFNEI